ncbi:monosaccharide-sensing protein 2-like [Bidens hawaiensis]|uniref:monosaccharide-sensing protein 2-like n=1 Tax=Bidens hawaiensis TaxID=980011 RepID=UPI00404AF083
MNGAALVAIIATIGNLLQGWDNATIAGAVVYIKKELTLGSTIEGLVVAMSLIGATLITTCSGPISDSVGRRPMLILSSFFYFIGGLIMLWSPNVYVLLLARLIDGFGVGLAVTLTPIYISETAPPEVRGLLNTLPQFTGSGGMFLAYCMVFGLSLMASTSWRLMLGVVSIPSFVYFILTIFCLPESPRWLVSKGKMREAKRVLQRLRGTEDVSGEMALLVEGLAVGGDALIEEFMIGLDNADTKDQDGLYGPERGLSYIAKPVKGQSMRSLVSRQETMVNSSIQLMDPLVTLFGSVHEKQLESGSMRSMLFPNWGSMFSITGPQAKDDQWDEESVQNGNEGYGTDEGNESDENLHIPLISRQATSGLVAPHGGVGIGGGWQLAWKWSGKEGEDGENEGGFKRMYLHQEPGGPNGSGRGSLVSVLGSGGNVQASALVSQPSLYSKELMTQVLVGPTMVHPSEITSKTPMWSALLEPGVSRALFVGVSIQMLQQFSGINGVMYYTPQILEQAGVSVLLSSLGLGSDSASFLISAFTTLLMLPCIAIAMWFMDITGRRALLLTTIPVLIASLVTLVISNIINIGSVIHAVISTTCVVVYFCCFVMAYGPIPNILCSEIFPTRVRGICIAICALVFWICDIIVTYTLPVMLSSIGLEGVFGIYAIVCVFSWVFVFLKVPETKGMPLEVITEFFTWRSCQE